VCIYFNNWHDFEEKTLTSKKIKLSRLGSQNNQMKKACEIIKPLTPQELAELFQIVG